MGTGESQTLSWALENKAEFRGAMNFNVPRDTVRM